MGVVFSLQLTALQGKVLHIRQKMARQIMTVFLVTLVTITMFYQTQANSISMRDETKRGLFTCVKPDEPCYYSMLHPCCKGTSCHLKVHGTMIEVGTCRPSTECKARYTKCLRDKECCSGDCSRGLCTKA